MRQPPPSLYLSNPTPSSTCTQESENCGRTFSSDEVEADSETELETDEFEFEDETSDSDSGVKYDYEVPESLESQLPFKFDSSKGVAEFLCAKVRKGLQLGRIDGAYRTVGSRGTNGIPSTYGSSILSSAKNTPISGKNSNNSKQRKRGLDADESDEAQESNGHGGNEKHRSKRDDMKQTFAGYFQKKNPNKYDPRSDRKYYMCPVPLKEDSEFRYIK